MAQRKPKLRYGVMYYHTGGRFNNPDRWGSTGRLERAYGHAASHVAKSDLVDAEYRRAVIYDKHDRRILRCYSRTANGITITDY